MKLPESFTTVTPLSKTLAIALFVSLPFIGFYVGQKLKICDVSPLVNSGSKNQTIIPTPTTIISPGKITITDNKNNRWGTYVNDKGVKFSFPPKYEIGYTGTNINNQDYFDIRIPPEEEMMPGTGVDFYVSFDSNIKSLVEYVASEVSLIKNQHSSDPRFKILNEKTVSYGNNIAYQFTVERSLSPPTDEIFFYNNGTGLHISETGIDSLEHSQIMNSVKFISK